MPHLRAALVGLHVLAVLVLSLPSSRQLLQRRVWERPSNQRAFAFLADRLGWLGIESTEDFEQRLWSLTEGYVSARNDIVAPFVYYTDLAGVRQGWGMFSRPRERPVELQIDIAESGGFQPVYRPGSGEYDFWSRQLRQYRFRKVTGSLARHFNASWYDPLTELLATKAADAYPDARRVRIRLYRYTTLPPEAIRAGETPKGRTRDARVYETKELR